MMVKQTLIASLTTALIETNTKNKAAGVTETVAMQNLAKAIADCVDAYIRTATIGTPSGPGTIQ